MRNLLLLLLALVTTLVLPGSATPQNEQCVSRDQLIQALTDFGNLKTGMSRQDIERSFVLDGGMNFRNHSYYVYSKCDLIRVEVTFEPDTTVKDGFSPRDRVTQLSKLYLGFPSKD